MKPQHTFFAFLLILSFALMPSASVYAAPLEISGWVPYWRGDAGTKSARKNLDALSVVHPFAYAITSSGGVKDLAGLSKNPWKRMIRDARRDDVLVVPTIMSGDTDLIHSVLSNETLREKHIEAIVKEVKKGGYDGIDIDYEGKRASTRPYFSAFLKELKEELGSNMLSCTIEARTPPKDLYRTVPDTIEYSNDFVEINKYCDRVNIMAYDQQRADLSLNDARKGAPYIPVSDSAWVRKVLELTSKTIDKDKLVLGVPTYGAEWELSVDPEWYRSYGKLWSLNPTYGTDTAKKEKVKPERNSAGELSFTYLPKSAKKEVGSYDVPRGTSEANKAAAQALAYANKTGKSTVVHVVWWSDAQAIAEKVKLAEEFGIKGVAIFKIDGGEDQGIWKLF